MVAFLKRPSINAFHSPSFAALRDQIHVGHVPMGISAQSLDQPALRLEQVGQVDLRSRRQIVTCLQAHKRWKFVLATRNELQFQRISVG